MKSFLLSTQLFVSIHVIHIVNRTHVAIWHFDDIFFTNVFFFCNCIYVDKKIMNQFYLMKSNEKLTNDFHKIICDFFICFRYSTVIVVKNNEWQRRLVHTRDLIMSKFQLLLVCLKLNDLND